MILVIGATSFIGPPVLKSLLEKNRKIKCLVRTGSNTDKILQVNAGISLCTGNLLSPDSIFNCLKEVESVVYLVDLKNTQLLKNFLLTVSKTAIRRIVFLSSTTVLVPQKSQIKDLKIESEDLIKGMELDWTILRPTMIYGTEDDMNYSKMLNFIKKRGFFVMFGNGQNLIQPIHVDDVAEAISLVLGSNLTFKKTYEICGKNPVKYIDMLKIIQSRTKRPFKIVKLPLKLSKAFVSSYSRISHGSSLKPDMIERLEFDKAYSYDKAVKDFGFSPISFEQGIEKLINDLQV